MKNKIQLSIILAGLMAIGLNSCQKGDLLDNPNAASTNSLVPPTLILSRITSELYNGGGVLDGVAGNQSEGPWDQVMRWNQFFVSNYSYYWGANSYAWSNSATMFSVLKYVELMESQAVKLYGANNVYSALGKFFRAYQFVWYTQRVGDIPMSQAGNPQTYPTPKYDSQHDVYKACLALLDTANTMMAALVTPATSGTKVDPNGDVFGMTYLQWQKVINTYKLRVLISLSKRATDNPDLNIPTQFANIVNNPSRYPIMTGNNDNMVYKYLASPSKNNYPLFPNYTPYVNYSDMCGTLMNLLTSNQDPRTFIYASPAPALVQGGTSYKSFAAYVGADITLPQATLLANSNAGEYSYNNYLRYYASSSTSPNVNGSTCEPYIVIGYPEMCFNIAEAANLGWIPGMSGAVPYLNGINASLAWYGLADGVQVTVGMPLLVGNNFTNVEGPVTIDVSTFLAQPGVVYQGDNANGLSQILQQKYVAFWQNSGWEAFYNWRRTGVPTFQQNGPGIETPNQMIPIRWLYPNDEAVSNTANYQAALTSQYGGTDDVNKPMWLIK
ncbi:MAG TPA: SusD/RagB family nutrient-binding outer membrane lipoprotein [Puia sp.]|nr:SusD/RagB family nutrient-binding outer membrane lipoprotein [Puia sp.]